MPIHFILPLGDHRASNSRAGRREGRRLEVSFAHVVPFFTNWQERGVATHRGHKPYFLDCPFDPHPLQLPVGRKKESQRESASGWLIIQTDFMSHVAMTQLVGTGKALYGKISLRRDDNSRRGRGQKCAQQAIEWAKQKV